MVPELSYMKTYIQAHLSMQLCSQKKPHPGILSLLKLQERGAQVPCGRWDSTGTQPASAQHFCSKRWEMKGEKGSTDSRSPFACSSSCLCHRVGRYRSTFPFQIPASAVLLASVKGDPALTTIPPNIPGRSLAAWAPGNSICMPRDLGYTGNSPKPFGLDAAPYRWIINPSFECLIL